MVKRISQEGHQPDLRHMKNIASSVKQTTYGKNIFSIKASEQAHKHPHNFNPKNPDSQSARIFNIYHQKIIGY